MLVARQTKVGGWNMNKAGDDSWWVTHRPSESQWHVYGPYGSKEEAVEESGMPKPKTELEEVWEAAEELQEFVIKAIGYMIAYSNLHYEAVHARDRFDKLSKKYGRS